ncbi:MAG: glycosyltransferase, partial [Deltaproteobacteria bacterium]|nr:glycosyltransferase [Deltaproteobacteria bacterium]
SITTNGLGLTEARARALIDGTVSKVNISINSATRPTYRRIMQIDGFDAVCRNARTFDALRKQAGQPVSLQFSAAINCLNIEEMPRLVELARETGADSINLFYTRFYPERLRDLNIEDPADRLKNEDSLFFHQQLSDDRMEEAITLAGRYGIRLSHEALFKEQAPPGVCTWALTQLMVGFDGEVYPCGGSEVHFREKVEKGIYDFGNALRGPVDVFWNSEAYRALRISARQGETCLVPECRCCANVISPNDVRSHIMDWGEDAAKILPPPISTLPLVSVIVPTYNRPDQLVSAVRSIRAQTYRKVEIIVVNDNGVDVADRLGPLNTDNNIHYIKHSRNRGLAAARNTGIRASRGKYLAYLDDDDLFYPDHLDTLVRFLEADDHQVAYTDAYRAHQVKEKDVYRVFKRDVPYSFDFDYDRILETNFVPVLCFVHARSCLDAVGLFDESLKRLEDWDLWIRMSRKFRFAHIPKITCEFSWRVDGTSMTSAQDQEFAVARSLIANKYGLAQPVATALPGCAAKPVPSLVSIVILTFNELKYTRDCLESIQKNTPEPHEIIFVDNGSKDGTLKWIRELIRKNPNYRLIENKTNFGFAKGCNQGLEASKGEYLLLLNNDVVVTKGWLSGLLECLESDPGYGLVGPMTNNISGIQMVEAVPYITMTGLEVFAKSFREKYRQRRIPSRRIVGFCLLFKRRLVEKIGLFD